MSPRGVASGPALEVLLKSLVGRALGVAGRRRPGCLWWGLIADELGSVGGGCRPMASFKRVQV